MISLLPIEQKHTIKREYYARIGVVGAVLALSTILIAGVLLIPFYFTLQTKVNAMERQLGESNNAGVETFAEHQETIREFNKRINILAGAASSENTTEVIREVVRGRNGIEFSSLVYTRPALDLASVRVNAEAATREALLAFVDDLRREGFSDVNLPVSNFVKNTDIGFSVEIIVGEDE